MIQPRQFYLLKPFFFRLFIHVIMPYYFRSNNCLFFSFMKGKILLSLADHVELILSHRRQSAEVLRSKFLHSCSQVQSDCLTFSEFSDLIGAVNQEYEDSLGASARNLKHRHVDLKRAFEVIDSNGDGRIDFSEFATVCLCLLFLSIFLRM